MKKKIPEPFFDSFGEEHPAWVNELRKNVEKYVGKPCAAYAHGCPSCQLWMAVHLVENIVTVDKKGNVRKVGPCDGHKV